LIFKNLGLNVENHIDFCINGKEMVEKIKQTYAKGHKYRLIFTDFSMPILDGIKATLIIREWLWVELGVPREEQPKIVGVTAHTADEFK
jgi:CheY-like chemotaxis protein